jgi:hypothetical protein
MRLRDLMASLSARREKASADLEAAKNAQRTALEGKALATGQSLCYAKRHGYAKDIP